MVRKLIGHGSNKQKEYRQKLSLKYGKANQTQIKMSIKSTSVQPCIKFGAINVNGMDLEVAWVVQEMISTRGIDVSTDCLEIYNKDN